MKKMSEVTQFPDRPDAEFDYEVKKIIEQNFPIEVIVDENHKTGYFKITSAYPDMAETVFRFKNASYDDVSNHLSFSYEILANPKNIDQNHPILKNILFQVIQVIYQLECQYLLKRK